MHMRYIEIYITFCQLFFEKEFRKEAVRIVVEGL